MNTISGFVEIPSVDLKLACKKFLDAQQKMIDDEREMLIQKEMSRMFFRAKRRDIAIARLQTRVKYGVTEWIRAKMVASFRRYDVEDLYDSACMAPSVLVNANFASLLRPYLETDAFK